MKADEVRESLRGIVWELAPKLATSVIDRKDYEYSHELATRIDAALALLKRFEEEAVARPGTDALQILLDLERKLMAEKVNAPDAQKGPSIWDLIQKPAL